MRYAAYFAALDAWTEYWDIYHPESHGYFYFGDGGRPGLLDQLVPRRTTPPVYDAWKRRALGRDRDDGFSTLGRAPAVARAALEYDQLVGSLFDEHFGCPITDARRVDYIRAIHHFATDTLPDATDRLARVPPGDSRRRTAGRHTIDSDIMWFVWALQLELAHLNAPEVDAPRRALVMAGVASGCPAHYVKRADRRTRTEYDSSERTTVILRDRATRWSQSMDAATHEVHALYRVREWGHE